MFPENHETNAAVTAQQEARAQLRESFIQALQELQGKSIKVLTYELSSLQATFTGWNVYGTEMLVKDLETPAHIQIPSALLRTSDILAVQFVNPVQLP